MPCISKRTVYSYDGKDYATKEQAVAAWRLSIRKWLDNNHALDPQDANAVVDALAKDCAYMSGLLNLTFEDWP